MRNAEGKGGVCPGTVPSSWHFQLGTLLRSEWALAVSEVPRQGQVPAVWSEIVKAQETGQGTNCLLTVPHRQAFGDSSSLGSGRQTIGRTFRFGEMTFPIRWVRHHYVKKPIYGKQEGHDSANM